MACRKNEAVSIDPSGIRWRVSQYLGPEGVGRRSESHGCARVTAVGAFYSVDREESDGVYGTPIDVVAGSGQASYGSVRQGYCLCDALS